MKQVSEHYAEVIKWNQQSGNRTEDYGTMEFWKSVDRQSVLALEEMKELIEAIQLGDPVEMVKELCDAQWQLFYLAEQLTKAGFDVDGAMKKVLENNSTKIFTSYAHAAETVDYHESKGVEGVYIQNSLYDGKDYYTVRDINSKIRKPKDFVSVDLTEFVPKEV